MVVSTFLGSPRVNGNSFVLLQETERILKERGNKIVRIPEYVKPCIGCGNCKETNECIMNNRFFNSNTVASSDAIVIASPIYFFSLTPQTLAFISRLYPIDLTGKIILPIIISGSDFEDSGIDIIRQQFFSIDRYCGTHTVLPYHKVTYDYEWGISKLDSVGLSKAVERLECAYAVKCL